MKLNKKVLGGTLAAVALAAMACSAGATVALADDEPSSTWPVPTAPKDNTVTAADGTVKTVVTVTANGCYRTLPEIIGLSNTQQNPGKNSRYADPDEALAAIQTDPDYGLFGSPANAQPDPYMWNYYYNVYATAKGLDTADPLYTCMTSNAGAAGLDSTRVAAFGNINTAMYHRPDVVYGYSNVYTESIETINSFSKDSEFYQEGDETYSPQLVSNASSEGGKFSHCNIMYNLAEATQTVMDASNGAKTTRYGDDPYEYAVEFEKYCRGTQYAVLKAIDAGTVKRKTVAEISAVDTDTKTVSCIVTDPSSTNWQEHLSTPFKQFATRYQWGRNIIENVTDNIGDKNNLEVNANDLYVAYAKDIMDCDAVILRTGNGMGDCDTDAEALRELLREAGYTDESKWPAMYYDYPDFPGGGGGNQAYISYYGTIIGFVYPEVLNPAYLDAYFCEIVYHVASTYLPDALNILYAKCSLPSGVTLDLSSYSHEAMNKQLNAGLRYYMNHKDTIDATYPNLVMTEWLLANVGDYSTVDISGGEATVEDCTYTGDALEPAPTVVVNGETLAAGTDYTVSYENNTNVGTATVTITGVEDYEGTITKTFTINAASVAKANLSTPATTYTYTGSAIEPGVVVKLNGKTLAASDYTIAYKNNTKVGSATATVTGTGNYTGTATVNFGITKASYDMSRAAFESVSGTYNGKAYTAEITGLPEGLTATYMVTCVGADGAYLGNSAVDAGTYYVTATFDVDGNHEAPAAMEATITIAKASNKMTAKAAKSTFKKAAKAQTTTIKVSNAAGKVTYKSNKAAVKVSAAGKVTIAKNFKGTVKITVKAAGNNNYKAASKTVTIKVK